MNNRFSSNFSKVWNFGKVSIGKVSIEKVYIELIKITGGLDAIIESHQKDLTRFSSNFSKVLNFGKVSIGKVSIEVSNSGIEKFLSK